MSVSNFFKLLLFITIPYKQYGQYTNEINSNRPGETMSAFSVGKNIIQVETGFFGISQKHNLLNYEANGFGIDATIRWGAFLEQLEIIADVEYQYDIFQAIFYETKRSDFKKTNLGAKYLLFDPFKNHQKKVNLYSWKANQGFDWDQLIPAVSVFAGANFTFAGNPYTLDHKSNISPKVMLIAQNHFNDDRWVFVTNIIADYLGTDYPSYGYVITLTHSFSNKWSGFVENQGYKSDFYSDSILRGGAAYLLNSNFQIDTSISTSFKNTPSVLYGGMGISWRYDGFYQNALANQKVKTIEKKGTNYQEIENKRKSKYE